MAADQPKNMEVVEIANNGLDTHLEPLYENVRRILSLLSLLSGGDCTREDIFARMKDALGADYTAADIRFCTDLLLKLGASLGP